MVEGRGSYEKTVRRLCGRTRAVIEMGGHSVVTRLVQTAPFDEGNLFALKALKQSEFDRPITRFATSALCVPILPSGRYIQPIDCCF